MVQQVQGQLGYIQYYIDLDVSVIIGEGVVIIRLYVLLNVLYYYLVIQVYIFSHQIISILLSLTISYNIFNDESKPRNMVMTPKQSSEEFKLKPN